MSGISMIAPVDFTALRADGSIYIDKTEWMVRLAERLWSHFFLARPRGFGKTLLLPGFEALFRGRLELFKVLPPRALAGAERFGESPRVLSEGRNPHSECDGYLYSLSRAFGLGSGRGSHRSRGALLPDGGASRGKEAIPKAIRFWAVRTGKSPKRSPGYEPGRR